MRMVTVCHVTCIMRLCVCSLRVWGRSSLGQLDLDFLTENVFPAKQYFASREVICVLLLNEVLEEG